MEICLIRHGMTTGNREKRYIGTTDEPLCEEGVRLLEQRREQGAYPAAKRIFVSPKKRCIQTARILYPDQAYTVVGAFAECDFGIFEGKNYRELRNVPEYQAWVDSGGVAAFPGGESKDAFAQRSLRAFQEILSDLAKEPGRGTADGFLEPIVCIVHGGTIMSIMERYANPPGTYYDFQVKNGEGYLLTPGETDEKTMCGNYRRI